MLPAGRRGRWWLISIAGAINAAGDSCALFNGLVATDIGCLLNTLAWPASLPLISTAVRLRDPGVPVQENTPARVRIPAVASGLALGILFVRPQSGAVLEIAGRGHELALHGWRHESWSELEPERERELLRRSLAAFAGLGLEPTGFRPPGGIPSPGDPELLAEHGLPWWSLPRPLLRSARDAAAPPQLRAGDARPGDRGRTRT